MIRPTAPADAPALEALTEATGVFKPIEIEALREVLQDYFASNQMHGHRCVVDERDGQPLGFAYYAPAAMTVGTWYLYWIAVLKATQAKGVGSGLLRHVEKDAAAQGARVLFIETSSLPHYEPTRRFYVKHAYEQGARLRDYYADGDDMVVYRKRLTG
jgi:ribosomal protein S18 acetylase RimI-like enzyme